MQHKHVLVTGGSSGIGLDLAKAYAHHGWSVTIVARDQEKIDDAIFGCQQISRLPRSQIRGYSIDISNSENVAAFAKTASLEIGTPDLIILSAGMCYSKRFIDDSEDSFESLMKTNVFGSRSFVKAFLPNMQKRRSGQICFVSSLAGIIPVYGYSTYSASKFALIGLAGALRQELTEYNIGVSVLCPPEVDTPLIAEEAKSILPQTRFLKDVGGTLDVKTVTKAAQKGIANNRFLIIPGVKAKFTYLQARLAPRLSAWITQKLINFASRS